MTISKSKRSNLNNARKPKKARTVKALLLTDFARGDLNVPPRGRTSDAHCPGFEGVSTRRSAKLMGNE